VIDWSVPGERQFTPWRELLGETKRRAPKSKPTAIVDPNAPWWARDPVEREDGRVLYRIGCLAHALDVSPQRLRRWIRWGWMPDTPFRAHGVDRRGNRRLFTRSMIEAAVRIADDERVLGAKRCDLSQSLFGIRLDETWSRLTRT
jgi:hypothetical protein